MDKTAKIGHTMGVDNRLSTGAEAALPALNPNIADASTASRSRGARQATPSLAARVASLWQQHGRWLWIIIPYALAWAIPPTWFAHLWFDQYSPVSYQPLVPVGTALLIWSQRHELGAQWRELNRLYAPINSRLKGKLTIAILGCVMLLLAHLVHLASLAVLGLILIAVGVVRQVYGAVMTGQMLSPLLYLGLMIPPPETAVGGFTHSVMQVGTARLAGFLAGGKVRGADIIVHGNPLTVGEGAGGASVLLTLVALTIWLVLALRCGPIYGLLLVGTSGIMGFMLNLFRVVIAVKVNGSNPELAAWLLNLNPWLIAAFGFAVMYGLGRVTRFGRRRPGLRLEEIQERMRKGANKGGSK